MPAFVRAAALGGYAEVARRAGLDPHRRLRSAGIDPAYLADPDLHIPVAAVAALLEDSARRSGCETLGLRMAQGWRVSDLGVVSLLLVHERTLRAALEVASRYRHLLNDSVFFAVEGGPDVVTVREEVVGGHALRSRQVAEMVAGILVRIFRAVLGEAWTPVAVRFVHGPPADLREHRGFFRAPIAFGQEQNAIVCTAADMNRPSISRDAGLARHAKRLLDTLPGAPAGAQAPVHEARRAIHLLLPMGHATLERVAHGMGMAPRGLQRLLEGAGTTFSALLDEARRNIAPRYLANEAYPVTQVGELLGFARPSSFTRWFRGAFGASPARWRRERR